MHFKCAHKADCSANCPEFVGPSEPYIGTKYERGCYPRVLFLSLDVPRDNGKPKPTANERTIGAQRRTERHYNPEDGAKNNHWYQTHEMVQTLLAGRGPTLAISEVKPYFAHTNSAKCSQGRDKHAQAHPKLFHNCGGYIGGELKILQPDVLVTQGRYAFDAVKDAVERGAISSLRAVTWVAPAAWKGLKKKTRYGVLKIGGKNVPWFVTFHPRQGVFFKQKAICWEHWSAVVKRFAGRTTQFGAANRVHNSRAGTR